MATRLDISELNKAKHNVMVLGGKVNVQEFGAVDHKGRSVDLLMVEQEEDGFLRLSFRQVLGVHEGTTFTKMLKPTPAQINKLLKAFNKKNNFLS